MGTHARTGSRISWLAATLLVGLALPAEAQLITRVGATVDTIPGQPLVRGTDAAHDPVRQVYLQVSAYGPVTGRFLNNSGSPVGTVFTISPGTAFGHYPAVAYSPHINGTGGFLVVWNQGDGPVVGPFPSNQVHARTIAYNNGAAVLGTDFVVGQSPGGNWTEAAPALAYSVTSQQFLVAWQSASGVTQVDAARLNVNGQPVSSVFRISDTQARDPAAAWNPTTNEFGVSYGGWDATSAVVTFARVRPSDGAVLRRNVIYRSSGSFITDIAFNTQAGTFVVAYAAPNTRTTEVNAAGDVVTHGLIATTVGTYDGLSIAYNPVMGTNILVGHYSKEIGGVLLDGHGAKIGVEQVVTAGGAANGSFYPKVTGDTTANAWQVGFARDFAAASSQLLTTTAITPPVDTDGDGVPDSSDACPTVYALTANGCPATPTIVPGDMNSDGKPDVVFEHSTTGMLYTWYLSNGQLIGESQLNPAFVGNPLWALVSKDDFTGDGKLDFLWQHQTTGDLIVWQMNGINLVQQIQIPITPSVWRVVTTRDFNKDGYPDILWQRPSDGQLHVWYLTHTGSTVAILSEGDVIHPNGQPVGAVGAAWKVAVTGDLNGDGWSDLVWQNQSTQAVVGWLLGANLTVVNAALSFSPGAGPWRVRMLNDMNNDGKLDLVWQNAVAASPLYVWYLNGAGGMVNSGFLGPMVQLSPLWRVVGVR